MATNPNLQCLSDKGLAKLVNQATVNFDTKFQMKSPKIPDDFVPETFADPQSKPQPGGVSTEPIKSEDAKKVLNAMLIQRFNPRDFPEPAVVTPFSEIPKPEIPSSRRSTSFGKPDVSPLNSEGAKKVLNSMLTQRPLPQVFPATSKADFPFEVELDALSGMGFTDEEKNRSALLSTQGDIKMAVSYLLQ